MAQREQSTKLGPLEFWDGISCTETDPGEAAFQMSFHKGPFLVPPAGFEPFLSFVHSFLLS